MYKFNGMKIGTVTSWREHFTEEYNDDGQLTLLSKETYHHTETESEVVLGQHTLLPKKKDHDESEDELAFDYRYVITATDLRRVSGEGNTIYVQLYLTPEPKDWHESSLTSASTTYGWEKETKEYILEHMRPQDAIENGYGVLFGRDSVEYDPDIYDEGFYDILDNKDATKMIDAAASAVQFYNGTRGFVIDKFQNRIGTTGWDTLHECLNGKDKIKATLDRLEAQNK